jgi:glycosyltransferase involved in cell wall biosynthesis
MPANPAGIRKLSIVIPCFNERDTVRTLLGRVLAVPMPDGWECEVIIVDDASTDGTREVLQALDLPARVLYRAMNGGKGTALVDGFALATGTHLLIQDADLEYDPADIPSLLAALDAEGVREIDGESQACEATRMTAKGDAPVVVYGSRNLRPNQRKGKRLLQLGVRFITALINHLYGTRLTDACTCYKLFPRSAVPLFRPGGFDSDILFDPALIRAGYRIIEVPISYEPRSSAAGKKIKYQDGIRAIFALLKDFRAHGSSSGMMGALK